ncbi:MAG: hypothetical protein ACKOAD_04495 [Gammaproteobacteria bacterium]
MLNNIHGSNSRKINHSVEFRYLRKPEDITDDLFFASEITVGHELSDLYWPYAIHKLINLLAHSSNIQFLSFSHCRLNQTQMRHLAFLLQDNQTLKHLNLAHTQQSNTSIRFMTWALLRNTGLESLILDKNNLSTQALYYLGIALKYNQTLKILSIAENSIDALGMQYLSSGLHQHRAMEDLNLENCNLSPTKIQSLSAMLKLHPGLKHLNISNNWLGDAGAHYLALGLSKSKQLMSLDISNNKIQNTGMNKIFDLLIKNCPLERLFFDQNPINDEALLHLGFCLSRNKTLKELKLNEISMSQTSLENLLWSANKHPRIDSLSLFIPNLIKIKKKSIYKILHNNFLIQSLNFNQGNLAINHWIIQRNQTIVSIQDKLNRHYSNFKNTLSQDPKIGANRNYVQKELHAIFKYINYLESLGYPNLFVLNTSICSSIIRSLKSMGSDLVIYYLAPWLHCMKESYAKNAYHEIGLLCYQEAQSQLDKGIFRRKKLIQTYVCLEYAQSSKHYKLSRRIYYFVLRHHPNLNYQILQAKITLGIMPAKDLDLIQTSKPTLSQYLNFRLNYKVS